MKAVQATLLHFNSTDEQPRHRLCPDGEGTWCKFQLAKAKGTVYKHKKPIPAAIVTLLKPIYARLGSKSLLEKCVEGYTQNANEAIHQLVWRFCPKEVFLGRVGVDIACALAVTCFNDGASSLSKLTDLLHLKPTPLSRNFLRKKDSIRIRESRYKMGRRQNSSCRRKRKNLDDKSVAKDGEMYVPGGFDAGEPGPSKRVKLTDD